MYAAGLNLALPRLQAEANLLVQGNGLQLTGI